MSWKEFLFLFDGSEPLPWVLMTDVPWRWLSYAIITAIIQPLGNGSPLQYSCLENPMDRGAWWAVVHGVAKSWTRLSGLPFHFHFPALEKEMATHSSVLAWRIPGTGEPGGLPSMGSQRVGHDWSDLAAATLPVLLSWRWETPGLNPGSATYLYCTLG